MILYLGWVDHYQIILDDFNEQHFYSVNKKYIEQCSVKKSFAKELPFPKGIKRINLSGIFEMISAEIKKNVEFHLEKYKENNFTEFSFEDGQITLYGERDMTEQEKLDAYLLKLNQDGPVVSFIGDNQVEIRLGDYIHKEVITSYEVHKFLKEVIEEKPKMSFSKFLFEFKQLKG